MYHPENTSMETAGSLTPQLEGAPHTTAHTDRSAPRPPGKTEPKGGTSHS